MMKVLQIGPISYVGGVSVHILRLNQLLKSQTDCFEITFIDESPLQYSKKENINIRRIKDSIKYFKSIIKSDIIHIHSVHWLIRIIHILFVVILQKPFIVTLHSFRISGFKKKFTLRLLQKALKVISVNKEIKNIITHTKINIEIKEAFIPPIFGDELDLPIEIENRIEIEKKNKILICANAFRLTSFKGKELYGLDQCIEVAAKLKLENLNVLIIFVISTVRKSDPLYLSLKKKIQDFDLEEYIWIIPYPISFTNLIKHSSIVLRPTLSDGDALTIREAIYLKKKIIASDVVERPLGTIIYRSGSSTDLYQKIIENINLETESDISKLEDMITYFNYYKKLYTSCNNLPKN